jgi:hypothetical protein
MKLGEVEWNLVNWIHLAQSKDQLQGVVKTVMNLPVSCKMRHFSTYEVTLRF